MIRVGTLENRFEADLVTEALRNEGVVHVLKPFHDTAYDGLFETTKGFALLLVEEPDADRARVILKDVRRMVESEMADAGSFEDDDDLGDDEDF
jgi:hypothetical protein